VAYTIIESQCTGCSSCEMACPNRAIREQNGVCVINPAKCTECQGKFDEPQCVASCPMKKTIVKL